MIVILFFCHHVESSHFVLLKSNKLERSQCEMIAYFRNARIWIRCLAEEKHARALNAHYSAYKQYKQD